MEEMLILLLQGLAELMLQILGSGMLDFCGWWNVGRTVLGRANG